MAKYIITPQEFNEDYDTLMGYIEAQKWPVQYAKYLVEVLLQTFDSHFNVPRQPVSEGNGNMQTQSGGSGNGSNGSRSDYSGLINGTYPTDSEGNELEPLHGSLACRPEEIN